MNTTTVSHNRGTETTRARSRRSKALAALVGGLAVVSAILPLNTTQAETAPAAQTARTTVATIEHHHTVTADSETHTEPGTTVITGADADTEAMIVDVSHLFAISGLELPHLRINVHPTDDGCDGHPGLYGKAGDPYRIDLCSLHANLVGHELAHAWEHLNVDDATRARYMDQMGVDQWFDHDAPHPARAIERAANAIAWGVREQPIQRMSLARHADELAAFELLTGRPSPRIAHLDDPVERVVRVPIQDDAISTSADSSRN